MSALLDEIMLGPFSLELAEFVSTRNDLAISEVLNRDDIQAYGKIPSSSFSVWAAQTGQRAVIEDTSKDVLSPLRAIALTMLDLLRGGLGVQHLDLGSASNMALVGAWKASGKMTQGEYESLLSLAETTISRADQLKIDCSVTAVSIALNEV